MEKIDSRRIMTDAERRGTVCPYLTKRGAHEGDANYCIGGACMAWRWRNKEPQYKVRALNAVPIPYWMSKDEAEYFKETGEYEIEEYPREPAGWCGYNE